MSEGGGKGGRERGRERGKERGREGGREGRAREEGRKGGREGQKETMKGMHIARNSSCLPPTFNSRIQNMVHRNRDTLDRHMHPHTHTHTHARTHTHTHYLLKIGMQLLVKRLQLPTMGTVKSKYIGQEVGEKLVKFLKQIINIYI